MKSKFKEKFNKEIKPALKDELKLSNIMAVPKVSKVVMNIGLGKATQDKKWIAFASDILEKISGQKPVIIKAKKSISNFKLREGMGIGCKVTLRGDRMYDFLHKLINSTIPRFRDFYGLDIKKGFDGNGNYTMGIKEHIVFPEIGTEGLEKIHGLEITLATTAKDNKQALSLLRALGFPFKKNKK
jgi:large subunit ribosomal protein L5